MKEREQEHSDSGGDDHVEMSDKDSVEKEVSMHVNNSLFSIINKIICV